MSATTSIQWTDRTWNPVRGCSVVSPGCVNCYAMKQAHRFSGPGKAYEGLTKQTKAGPQWTGQIRTVDSALREPSAWRQPSRVFVNSMSDLFHESVPFEFIDRVFNEMWRVQRHTFQVLTKRALRMREYIDRVTRPIHSITADRLFDWPLPNVWLGVSVEDQQRADERIPLLLQTPAVVRFLSCEPLLSGLDIAKHRPGALGLHWVIIGGESGPGARPFRPWWARNIINQCRYADVAPFVKQLGSNVITRNDDGWEGDTPKSWPMDTSIEENINGFREEYQGADVRVRLRDSKGGDMAEWPEYLRVREFPASKFAQSGESK